MIPSPVRLTRRVSFSAGHRYWRSDLDEAGNRALFGAWASPYNHGHNYALELTIEGTVEPSSGMVVNIKLLDERIRETIVQALDGRSINDEVPEFAVQTPTIENLLAHAWKALSNDPLARTRLVRAKLEETDEFYGEFEIVNEAMIKSITRSYEFAASHRLHSPVLSDAQNVELFGKCNNPMGHGHNFVLEVTIEGEPDGATGMIADLSELDRTVGELVVDRYDHKHLNEDIPEFTGRVVTSEVLASEIFSRLNGKVPAKLRRIRLYETARSAFEVSAA